MSKYQTPCRYDFVGSFLRPQEVKQAKADYAEGKISEEEKDRIIDAAIADVVKKQKEHVPPSQSGPCDGGTGR